MVRSTALFFGLSLLAASVDAGSHITGHSPSRRMSALKKRGHVVRNNHLGEEPPSHVAAAEEDCIQQCKAKSGLGEAAPPPAGVEGKNNADAGAAAAGGGKVKKVTVAPEQGVLRFVPFNINVKAGETIKFEWGGGPHTVVKASPFSLCNQTQDGTAFASEKLEAGGTFDITVNDTNPVNYYCSVQPHCTSGMFATINGASASPAKRSVQASALIDQVAASSPSVKAMLDETNQLAAGTDALTWGETLDVGEFPEWAQKAVVENVLATRQFYAKNPEQLAFDMDQTDEAPATPAAEDAPAPEPTQSGTTVVDSSSSNGASYGGSYGGSSDAESDSVNTDTSSAVLTRRAPFGGALIVAALALMT